MPGNELGDRVHNFFAQGNASPGQHQSHVMEGNWAVPNSNFWAGSPRPVDMLNSSSKNFSGQNSEIDRAQSSYPVHAAHGLNFSQSNLRPDFSRGQPLIEQQYSNGYMYGNQFSQSRQNEANFREPDTYTDQRHLFVSRGLPMHELQRISSPEQQSKGSDRSETSASPVSFDLFGGQQQMNHQHASMPQALQRQQSGFNDMQLQQQIMLRKMEELQRQQQLQQLDLRSQNPMNQVHPASKQSPRRQSSPYNGSPNSNVLRNPWTVEPGRNWLGHSSSAMQGSSSGIGFLPNFGHTQPLMDVAHQQVDQSLYGVPVSNSRGLVVNQHSPMVTEGSSVLQMPASTNSLHNNQLSYMPDRHTRQVGTSISRQNFQNETNERASGRSLNTGIMDMGFHQHVNSMQNNAMQQDHVGRQELATPSETSHARYTMQASLLPNESALDPAEEKILYGTDDNILSAFGRLPSVSREAGNLFESSGISNGFPSIQSGSWSALMQSAVAETSSADVGPQDEWSDLNFHNKDGSSENQPPLVLNENVKQSSLANDGVRIPSAMGTESFLSSNINTLRRMGQNQLGQSFQREPCETVPTDVSHRFGQSLAGTRKSLNHRQVQNSLASESDICGNASEDALGAEKNGKAVSRDWPHGQSGTRPQPNGWNALAAVPPGGDRALNILDTKNVSQNSRYNQVRVMEGQMVDGASLWKPSPLTSGAEFGTVRSMTGNHQPNKSKGDLSVLHDTTSVANSCNTVAGDGANPFTKNNYLLNQWRHTSHSRNVQGAEGLGRMKDQVHDQNQGSWKSFDKDETTNYDGENCAMKDNSNDSHLSNLSSHASGGLRESGAIDAIDSRALSSGKQKSNNQPAKKASALRKFQYHPMGNLDDDVGSNHGLKQPNQAQAITLQNSHFGQLNLFGQAPRNPTEKVELSKDNKHLDKEPSGGSYSGFAPGTSNLFGRSFGSSSNKASPPSQNMLELLHKVDQSGDHDSLMHLNSSERQVSSQPSEAENSNGSAGRLQRRQSSLPQGFGLQLGPPSQLLQTPDLSSPSQNAQSLVNATHNSYTGTGMGEKSMSPFQSRQFPNEKTQMDYENDTSTGPTRPWNDNSVSKLSENYHSALTSDTPYARNQLQNRLVTRLSAITAMNPHIDSSFHCSTSHSVERGSAETLLPDASGNLQKNNPPSGCDSQQSGPYDIQEIAPAGSASSRDQMHGSQHFGLPDISRPVSSSPVLHNMWTNVPTPLHTAVAQYPKGPSHVHEPTQPNILESSSCGDLDVSKGVHISSKHSVIHAGSPVGVNGEEHRFEERFAQLGSAPKIEVSLGSASFVKNRSDESPANSASTQKDIEDFGRSLKPNNSSSEEFALLNQMKALKNAGSDPKIRFLKRSEASENIHDVHQEHVMSEKQSQDNFRNSLGLNSGVPPEDSRVVGFSSPLDSLQRNALPHENADPEDVAAVTGLDDSRSKTPADGTAVRIGHHMVSPQMAPSWFNQYGSFKNGQLLPLQNVPHAMSSRPEETPFAPGMSSSVVDTSCLKDNPTAVPFEAHQVTTSLKSSDPAVEANEHLSSLSLPVNVASQHQVILRPMKRKSATTELLSWSKEISHCSQSPFSVVEADWSKAVNCLPEKVEDCVDLIEDGPQMLRSKRRLILTTQLMQQIFCPLPTTVLSADASSEYESVAYAVSRVALGDACSALSTSSNMGLPRDGIDLHAVKGKLNGDPRFAKVIEDLLGKATKLENDFLRLDKSASILDLRLECQDLEKFSVINRFAKFHGRGQTDNAETSSTDATATTHKPCAQRYVTAVSMPRSLPDMEDGHEVSSNVLEAV